MTVGALSSCDHLQTFYPYPGAARWRIIAQPLFDGTMNGNGSEHGASGGSQAVEGNNVVRVAFGVRRARRSRPQRPERWATLVLPLQLGGGSNPTPPHAA